MTEDAQTVVKYSRAIEPRKKFGIIPVKKEAYPTVQAPTGEKHIVMPVADYRRFRGDARFWQFMFALIAGGFGLLFWWAMSQPPTVVEKPVIVEKEVVQVVPSRCLFWCK